MKEKLKEMKEEWRLLPILIAIGIIPYIMRTYSYDTNLAGFSWYGASNQSGDIFNYYKSSMIVITAVVMMLILGASLLEKRENTLQSQMYHYIPLAIYAILAVISTICSKYQWFGIHGISGHFETIFVLLGYCLMAYYSYVMVRSPKQVKILFFIWAILLLPMMLLGISQAVGRDFLRTSLGQQLLMSREAFLNGGTLDFKMEQNRVYLSLYNPNYVGSFCVLVIPVFTTLMIFADNWKKRGFYGFLLGGAVICMIGGVAKTAAVVIVVTLCLLFILLRKNFVKYWKGFAVFLVSIFVMMIGVNAWTGNRFLDALKSALTIKKNTTEYKLEEINTWEDALEIRYAGNQLFLTSEINENGQMGFDLLDGRQSPVELGVSEDYSYFTIEDERFSSITIRPVMLGEVPSYEITIDGTVWTFSNHTNYQGYYYYSPYGKFTFIRTAPSFGFEGYERLASGRGYIWSRSIPLLKDTFFIGSGPDTFLIKFPQTDYVAKSRYGYLDLMISKPHNMFLQIGVNTGVLSLLAFLAFYLMYFISCIKLYWKNPMDTYIARIGAAILASTLGYMISGLSTDSTVTVAPIFWCLMGIGIAVNGMIKKQEQTN